jgi:hypothetical protein
LQLGGCRWMAGGSASMRACRARKRSIAMAWMQSGADTIQLCKTDWSMHIRIASCTVRSAASHKDAWFLLDPISR